MKKKLGWWMLAAVAAAPMLAGWFLTVGALACAITGRTYDGSAVGGVALLVFGFAVLSFAINKLEPPYPDTPESRVTLLLVSVLAGGFCILAAALASTTRVNHQESCWICGVSATISIAAALLWLRAQQKAR